MKDYPLLDYAAKQRSVHFRRGALEPTGCWVQTLFPTKDRTVNQKDRTNGYIKSWRQARGGFGYHEPFMTPVSMEATPLFFVSEAGLTSVARHLLAFGYD